MATYRKKDDPWVSCPFNPAHRTLSSRLPIHIIKCKQDHPGANKKTCQFNAKHLIDSAEFNHHLMVCPDKGLVEMKIAYDSSNNGFRGNTQVPNANEVPPSQDECWEDDPDEDPQTTKRTIPKPRFKDLILISQMKPAERKKYYASLHRRQSGDEDEDSDDLKEPVVQRKVLKELPQPKLQPQEDQNDPWENLYAAGPSGRGRIAANIFGQAADSALYTCTPYHPGGMARGRGRGAEAVNVANYPLMPNAPRLY